MRRRYVIALAVIPLGATVVAHGCSSAPPFESLCAWVANPDNCFREFREDMLTTSSQDCRTAGSPTEVVSSTSPGTPNGVFQTWPLSGTCIINNGGSVTIDPPIDVTQWPPDVTQAPVQYTLTFNDATGTTCGTATYTSPHGFSITINQPPPAATIFADAGAPQAPVDDGGAAYAYGTYIEANTSGTDEIDVTCPSGDTFNFNLDEAIGPPLPDGGHESGCSGFAAVVPEARLLVDTGNINAAGAISFAIDYPPTSGAYPGYSSLNNPQSVQPDTVVYFNCTVPQAPPTCMDSIKDGEETDVDCGGPLTSLSSECPARCLSGMACLCNADCASDACIVDPTNGNRTCGDGTIPGSFPRCKWAYPAGYNPSAPDAGSTTTDAGSAPTDAGSSDAN